MNAVSCGRTVCKAAESGDTEGARKAVSMIVGRDTDVLDRSGIIAHAVGSGTVMNGIKVHDLFLLCIQFAETLTFTGNPDGNFLKERGPG